MRKREFLDKLSFALASISAEERKNIVGYYDELISDKVDSGLLESEVVADLGSIEGIVKRLNIKEEKNNTPKSTSKIRPESIERNYVRYDNKKVDEEKSELQKRNIRLLDDHDEKKEIQRRNIKLHDNYDQTKKEKTKTKKSNNDKAVLVITLILTSPIWLTLLMAIFIVFLALIIASLAITFSMFITGVALILGGIGGCIAGLMQIGTPLGIFTLGAGIICIGVGFILGPIFFKIGLIITKGLWNSTKWLFSKMFGGRK